MHKRGDVLFGLTKLVDIIIHILPLIIVIGLLAALYMLLLMPEKPAGVENFERFTEEIKNLRFAKGDRAISIPLSKDATFDLLVQSPESTVSVSPKCPIGTACLCFIYGDVTRCEQLPGVKKGSGFTGTRDCPTTCGGEILCIPYTTKRFSISPDKKVVVKRICNNVEISVMEIS